MWSNQWKLFATLVWEHKIGERKKEYRTNVNGEVRRFYPNWMHSMCAKRVAHSTFSTVFALMQRKANLLLLAFYLVCASCAQLKRTKLSMCVCSVHCAFHACNGNRLSMLQIYVFNCSTDNVANNSYTESDVMEYCVNLVATTTHWCTMCM